MEKFFGRLFSIIVQCTYTQYGARPRQRNHIVDILRELYQLRYLSRAKPAEEEEEEEKVFFPNN